MKRYGRVDANHKALRDFLRAHGVRWLDLSSVGKGCPDALVSWGGRHLSQGKMFGAPMELVEVKDGAKVKSAQKLTAAQAAFHQDWPVWTLTNEADALALIRWLKREGTDR